MPAIPAIGAAIGAIGGASTVATLGAAAIGAVASNNAAKSQNRAITSAANTQAEASNANIAAANAERARNESLFAPYLQDEAMAKAYADALAFGQATYSPMQTSAYGYTQQAAPVTITRDQVLQQIQGTPLAQLAETTYAERQAATEAAYGSEANLAEQGYTGFRERAERDLAARTDTADARRTETDALADTAYGQSMSEADRARADRQAAAEAARTGLRGVGDENFANTQGLLDTAYATRQGLTDAAVAAWEAQAQEARDRAISAAASRMGVTGQTGRTARTIGDVEAAYGRDRALYEAERDLADFNVYDAGLLGADAQRGQTYLGAETAYGDDLRALINFYNGDVNRALAALSAARASNAGRYYDDRAVAYDQFADYDQAAYGARQQALTAAGLRRNAGTQSNIDTRAGDRLAAYGSYSDFLSDRMATGERARQNIASGGQATLGITTAERTRGANAQADAAYARGQVNQTLYGDLARIAGDAWGAIRNDRDKDKPAY